MEDEFENDILEQLGEDVNDVTIHGETNDDEETIINEPGSTNTQTQSAEEEIAGQLDLSDGNGQTAGTKSEPNKEEQQAGQEQNRGPQDLVDGQGNVIAKGGKERRFYETAQKEKQRAENLEQQFKTQTAELDAYKQASQIGNQLGLTPQEITSGAHVIANMKSDPIGTLKHLLTQAQAAGYNIDDVSGTDMTAIKQMIAQELAPVTNKVQQEQQQSANYQEAQKVYNNFLSDYPDAAIHENTIARLLQEQPNLSLEAAYYKLQSFYAHKGLDFTKSLATIEQEYQANSNQQSNVRTSLPQGVNVNPNMANNAPVIADVNTSYEDIIREAMREAGTS